MLQSRSQKLLGFNYGVASMSVRAAISMAVWLIVVRPARSEHLIGNIHASAPFLWDPAALGSLIAVINNFRAYETPVQVELVSDNAIALQKYLKLSGLTHVKVHAVHHLENSHDLPRAHFELTKRAAKSDRFDTFIYVESDVLVPWSALQAWAHDVEQLQAKGFQRGLLRVGMGMSGDLFCPDNAPSSGSDDNLWRQPALDLSTWNKSVEISNSGQTSHFVQLRHSFWSGYVLTAEQMQKYMQSDKWAVDVKWGAQEDAAMGNQFVDVPPGFDTNTVVPYDPQSRRLQARGFAVHLSNKFALSRGTDQVSVFNILDGH